LEQILESFIAKKALAALIKQHRVDLGPYFRAASIPAYAAARCRGGRGPRRLLLRAIENGWGRKEIAPLYATAFAVKGNPNWAINYTLHWVHRRAAYIYSVYNCFPRQAFGKPALWLSCDAWLIAEPIAIDIVLKRHPRFFTRIADVQYGTWHLVSLNPIGTGRKSAAAALHLFKLLPMRGGVTLGTGRLGSENSVLSLIGSPTRVYADFGTTAMLSRWSKLPATLLRPGRILMSNATSGPFSGFLYVYQKNPSNAFKTFDARPFSFQFTVAERYLLGTIIRKLTARLKVREGLKIPTVEEVIKAARSGSNVGGDYFGVAVPELVTKLPWGKK
jgi:hypothetical protein